MIRPQLKTFLTVCEAGSFSKAAAELFLTPSAVLQQIRTLEKHIGTPLFERNSTGVTLTPAGRYLEEHVRTLVHLSDEIKRETLAAAVVDKKICVATSLIEKVRLLSDLWVLYSQQEPACEIQMVNIDPSKTIPPNADMIESINSSIPWMLKWNFLEICQVPMGFAVPNDHPLAGKKLLTLNDLRGQKTATLNSGSCPALIEMMEQLQKADVTIDLFDSMQDNILWEFGFRHELLITPVCWSDILINMTIVPFEKNYTLPYGIFYRTDPSPQVKNFLDFIASTYQEGNRQGIVPVLF